MPRTLFDKIWAAHEVAPGLVYIDLHLVHEVTSPQAFDGLRLAGRRVRRPDRTLATGDCVTFDADLPHHFENPGPGEAALLAVVSAGLRRS